MVLIISSHCTCCSFFDRLPCSCYFFFYLICNRIWSCYFFFYLICNRIKTTLFCLCCFSLLSAFRYQIISTGFPSWGTRSIVFVVRAHALLCQIRYLIVDSSQC